MSPRLQNRIALITGSSSGIGRATAFAFAREGAYIVCADISPGTWRENAPSDEANGPTHERIQQEFGGEGMACFVKTDVSVPEQVEAAVKEAVRWGGRERLDVMINNAGFALESRSPAPIYSLDLDLYHKTTSVNINGVVYGTKYASAQMISQTPLQPSGDRGWILNASSVFALNGTEAAPAYCTSKGAVANLTRAAAMDCAPYRVHVNAVCPGFVHTHMTDEIFKEGSEDGKMVDSLHPFRGRGRPEDIARAYVFLASEDAGWMTGVNMPVDGGFSAR